MKKKTVTCIIPFLNEKGRIASVLKEIVKGKNLDQIICVDDGSTDGGWKRLKKKFKEINLIRTKKNIGKLSAVKLALEKAEGDYIFLCDSDIIGIEPLLIEKAINIFKEHSVIDMLILRGKFVFPNTLISRSELIFSGQRIIKKVDLINVLNKNIKRFQLEIALNDYMLVNKKNVYWIQTNIRNIRKSVKYGFLKGTVEDLRMVVNVMSYGIVKYFYQILFFARKKLQL